MENNQTIKSVCGFLNEQMERFEHTAELQSAIDNLVRATAEYFFSESAALCKKEDRYTVGSIWPDQDVNLEENFLPFLANHTAKIGQGKTFSIEREKQTLYIKPLLDENQVIALLVVKEPAREMRNMIKDVLDVLGTWLENRLVKRDYVNRDDRIQKLLSGLGNDYTAVYTINLDTDTFEIVINQHTNNVAKLSKHNTFSAYLDNYADTYVLEEYREEMKKTLRYQNLRKHFEEHEDLWFRFHSVPNILGQTCFEAHAVREYEDNGHFAVVGFRCVDAIVRKELTYQKKLDEAYQNAQKQLDVITSSIPGGIKISYDDPAYSFKYVSRQYAQMLGYDTVEEFMQASGGTIVGIAHPDDVENGIADALEQYSHGNSYEITYRMKCKDGSWKYIEDHGQKVINSNGEVEHWNLILDKHELVEKTIELESAKRAGEAKTAFLSRMSHDIRTPLNGIIGLLEYDERHPDQLDVITANRKKAHVAAQHLLSLVSDILELNKLDDEKVTLVEEPFDFSEMLHEVGLIGEMRAAEESVTVIMDESCSSLNHQWVLGSPLHVKQILLNILSNAIKYNRVGGTVECSAKEKMLEDGKVQFQIRIKDTGIGMSEEFQNQMFAPFVQEKYDARSVYQGSGLGLSIVKRLVDYMGGTIDIQSQVNVGTEVKITLAFKKSEAVQKKTFAEIKKDRDLAGLKVLLVEDNELNMEISKYMLEDEKMHVTEAYDGEQALNLFEESPVGTFDIILMDVMMPVMDGLTATREIRKLKREDAKKIPIFAMTANAFAEDVKAAKDAGMNEHIAKPIEVKHLMKHIAQYCCTA